MASVDQKANSVASCTPVVSIVTLPIASTKNSQPSNAINTGCLVTNPALVTTPTSQPVLITAPAKGTAAPSKGVIVSDPSIAGAKLVVRSNSSSSTSGGQALVALSPGGAIGTSAVTIVTSPNVGPTLTTISAADWTAKLKEIQTAERLAKLREEEQAARNTLDRRTVFELCVVCGDKASGRHYGAISCEGCKGFFKRSIRKQLGYACRGNKDCEVTKHHRNRCQYCRLQKCMVMGMRSDSVQSERKPLDSKERSGIGITATTQKIYIRKDLRSPLAATPTFVGDRVPTDGDVLEKALGLIDAGLIANSAAASNTVVESDSLHSPFSSFFSEDLSTLASVVTTLATMGKKGDLEAAADLRMAMNGEALASSGKENSLISKAFDTMARAVQSQSPMIHEGSTAPEHITLNMDCENESLFEIEGPLLMDSHIPFNLTTPTPMPSYLNLHFICESASRLLFLSVHWARSIPAFQLLSPEVQVTLVRGCWSELFTLGLAQCSQVISLPTILAAIINHLQTSVQQEKMAAQRIKQVSDHICKLQDYVNIMLRLQVDEHEYAYLKAIMLFSPDHPSLPGARQVEKFQDKSYQDLRNYINQTFPDNPDRFPKLLLRLPTLRSLQPSIMEELFFTGLIGNVQIDSVIPYILRMETSDYTGHMGGGQMAAAGNSNEAVDMTTSTTSSASQSNGQESGSFSPSHSGSLKLVKQET